jgi:hypothetical protein
MKYAIINIEVLEKRIEELDKDIKFLDNNEPSDYPERKSKVLIQDKKERAILREILSNTIPLEKELKNAYYAGKANLVNADEYIQNLKLKE